MEYKFCPVALEGPPWAAVLGHLLPRDGLVPSQIVVLLQPTSSWGAGVGNREPQKRHLGVLHRARHLPSKPASAPISAAASLQSVVHPSPHRRVIKPLGPLYFRTFWRLFVAAALLWLPPRRPPASPSWVTVVTCSLIFLPGGFAPPSSWYCRHFTLL